MIGLRMVKCRPSRRLRPNRPTMLLVRTMFSQSSVKCIISSRWPCRLTRPVSRPLRWERSIHLRATSRGCARIGTIFPAMAKTRPSSTSSKLIEEAEFSVFNEFLIRLKGTLLDVTSVLFGSNLGDASSHDCRNLPIIVAGGGVMVYMWLMIRRRIHRFPISSCHWLSGWEWKLRALVEARAPR